MKKIIYLLLILTAFISITGFRGCNYGQGHSVWEDFAGSLSIGIYGGINNSPFGFSSTLGSYNICVGDNGTIYSCEGRPPYTWIGRQSGTTLNLNSVKCLNNPDSTIAYAVGDQGIILRSSDKGFTWIVIRTPNPNQPNLNSLDFIPSLTPLDAIGITNIICVGEMGAVIKSSNSGGNWNWVNLAINTSKKLNSIAVASAGLFSAVGDSGAVYRTLNGGINWENRSVSSSVSLKKIVSTKYDRYCSAGTNGSIYTSTDYGYSWNLRNSGTTRTFRDILFSGLDSGAAAGDFGTIRLTTNGGLTWYNDSYLSGLTTKNILGIARSDINTVSCIASNSIPGNDAIDTSFFLALSTEPFNGIDPISSLIAEVFSLKQNYPNPFNPVTKIRFDIPIGDKFNGNVKLVIYDIIGREVAVLLNENLKPGEYEIEWNAAGYPSGVYFYELITAGYVETRKMILIK